eukprot:CAMPEP_0173105242 /NCGR_PEP_ID=MMETSP1102-20130122/39930_1 /TAXON_ID=49646 /ORGANISM="Geminigera sp., Strain Caron Lab Isolate" /LENGTH=45 /DNA_ID= /DNA_START= /DNA_END= /DNA_ORIENTATION=
MLGTRHTNERNREHVARLMPKPAYANQRALAGWAKDKSSGAIAAH